MKTYDGPGQGRKQCPQCKEYIGVRTQVCMCGHEFKSKPIKTQGREETTASALYLYSAPQREHITGGNTIGTPAGPVPFKLTDLTENGIFAWVEKNQTTFYRPKP